MFGLPALLFIVNVIGGRPKQKPGRFIIRPKTEGVVVGRRPTKKCSHVPTQPQHTRALFRVARPVLARGVALHTARAKARGGSGSA